MCSPEMRSLSSRFLICLNGKHSRLAISWLVGPFFVRRLFVLFFCLCREGWFPCTENSLSLKLVSRFVVGRSDFFISFWLFRFQIRDFGYPSCIVTHALLRRYLSPLNPACTSSTATHLALIELKSHLRWYHTFTLHYEEGPSSFCFHASCNRFVVTTVNGVAIAKASDSSPEALHARFRPLVPVGLRKGKPPQPVARKPSGKRKYATRSSARDDNESPASNLPEKASEKSDAKSESDAEVESVEPKKKKRKRKKKPVRPSRKASDESDAKGAKVVEPKKKRKRKKTPVGASRSSKPRQPEEHKVESKSDEAHPIEDKESKEAQLPESTSQSKDDGGKRGKGRAVHFSHDAQPGPCCVVWRRPPLLFQSLPVIDTSSCISGPLPDLSLYQSPRPATPRYCPIPSPWAYHDYIPDL